MKPVSEDLTLLEQCKKTILSQLPGATIIFYGSRARGKGGPESDYDLLILIDDEASPEIEERIGKALYKIELEHGVVISDFILSRKIWESSLFKATPFHQEINWEGVIL